MLRCYLSSGFQSRLRKCSHRLFGSRSLKAISCYRIRCRFDGTKDSQLCQVGRAFGIFRCFGQWKTTKTKSQQNKRGDYQVPTTMKNEANWKIKRLAIVATFFVLASLSSTRTQWPTPVPRPQLQNFSAKVFDGPTPFIRFVHIDIDDIGGFNFAQFLIFPKTGSVTRRPISVRYARSYLEARGYFDSRTGKLIIPIYGLYAGRANRVTINLGFSSRFHPIKRLSMLIRTPQV